METVLDATPGKDSPDTEASRLPFSGRAPYFLGGSRRLSEEVFLGHS